MADITTAAGSPRPPIPLLPVRNAVLFPGTVLRLHAGRPSSAALAADLKAGESLIGVVAQKERGQDEPDFGDLHPVATLARVVELGRTQDGAWLVVVEGLSRFALTSLASTEPYRWATGEDLPDRGGDTPEARALAEAVKERFARLAQAGASLKPITVTTRLLEDPGLLADRAASAMGLSTEQQVDLLAETDVVARLRAVLARVDELARVQEIRKKIDDDVRAELGKGQKEHILRQQLRAIQKELGEDDDGDELGALKKRLDDAQLPEEARKVADRELRRLEAMNPQQAEHGVIRTYLEWIADLPWSRRGEGTLDLKKVREKLDADHYGLDDVKKRILQHLAVLKLSGNPRGTILCLAGPPGVGKTSLGQSVADALGRPFVRIALGGVRDEAEVRGHRRTYVGALPGRVIHGMRKAGARDAVVLMDEIDKLGKGWAGDPEAALLEVLDPAQNKAFTDHYLEIPFDLSEVLFLCTANDLSTLSPPLRDRLEVIEIQGYTPDEKVRIARAHLLPRQLRESGLAEGSLAVTDEALAAVVRDYTREAGVRQLEREIGRLCRAAALEVADRDDGAHAPQVVDAGDLVPRLGRPRFTAEVAERTRIPGVATGLAWTPVGGDILFVETSRMPGTGRLEITGQLGDVMKESARAALTYVRSNAGPLGVDPEFLGRTDVHIHVPAGAVPKDGPSAGVTMFTALTSLLTGRKVRSDTAMTGECTLRGRVLPVGGIKSKVLAAHRAGLTRVVLPHRNAADLDDVPAETRAALDFVLVEDMEQVLEAALEPAEARPPADALSGRGRGAELAVA
ncbi:endopeptidase La [Myxococcota bacterium]|nr:endopeptidase La [Myxococcota bacterium]